MSVAWLRDLEERVAEAAEQLRTVRRENADLRQRVESLEGELAAAEKAGAKSDEWQAERDEVKERVQGLVSHLEELLGDDGRA